MIFTPIQIFIIFLKLAIPASMLVFPLFGLWGNYLLDIVDGDLLQGLGLSDNLYQTIDKSADLISYIFMLILAWRWQIKKTVLVLFIYRLIGQLLFFITGNEIFFFYFQNFLEPLLLIYVLIIFKQKSEKKAYLTYLKHWKLLWIIVIAYKLWNEWYLHFANIDLSTILFGVNGGS